MSRIQQNLKPMLFVVLVLLFALSIGMSLQDKSQSKPKTVTTYQENILPLLKNNCTPCHFEGGKVYDRYPFDDYETVKTLGTKLNTRFKEQEQKSLVVNWLKAGAKEK